MRRLCVIPARGGSKRIPRKNVKPFLGRPALAWSLRAARESGLFDHVEVSTEDEEIAALAARLGHPPRLRRDPALADDDAPVRAAVIEAASRLAEAGERFDVVALVYATAVLIEPEDLKAAAAAFEAGPRERPLLAVSPVAAPVERLMVEADGVLRPLDAARFGARSQALTHAVADAGAFCFFDAASLVADGDAAAPLDFRGFTLARTRAVDIDTEDDWAFAEAVKAGSLALSQVREGRA